MTRGSSTDPWRRNQILAHLREHGAASADMIATAIDLEVSSVRSCLGALKRLGLASSRQIPGSARAAFIWSANEQNPS